MTEHILVSGATGNVGEEVIHALPDKQTVRAAVRDIDKARAQLGPEIGYVRFNFAEPETFAAAFDGITHWFLVRPPQLANVSRDIAPSIQAAEAAGVKHVVFLSLQGVENNRIVPHYHIEQALNATAMSTTYLRAGFFMQNLSTTHREEIKARDEIFVPAGDGKTSFIDARDIAAVGALALTEPEHENKAYTLTGSEALTYGQVAEVLTHVLDRPIRYANPSPIRFIWHHLRQGTPPAYTLVMTALYATARLGRAGEITPDLPQLLGRPPITFRQFAKDYRDYWL